MKRGFTLAELLIALAILGVIATFTIPKVLNSSSSGSSNGRAKEVVAMVVAAYQNYQAERGSAPASMDDITPNLNYVSMDTNPGSLIDEIPNYGPGFVSCGAPVTAKCLRLHGGGCIRYRPDQTTFPGTASNDAIFFYFDPDGVYSGTGTLDGPGKSITFILYTNYRVTTYGQIQPGTNLATSGVVAAPNPADNPSWFSWSN